MEAELLREKGLKNTPSRQAVLEVLAHTEEPVSLSTVYRTLSVLAEKGLKLKHSSQDGTLSYQLRDSRHRHYLICTQCGSSVPIPGCPLEELERNLGERTGFAITGHSLELYGLCPQCIHKKDSEE